MIEQDSAVNSQISVGRSISWCLLNGGVFALAILGVQYGEEWALNIFKFLLWMVVVLYGIGLSSPDSRSALSKKGRSVPAVVSLLFDLSLAIFLAAYGLFFYAALQVIQMIFYEGIYAGTEDNDG